MKIIMSRPINHCLTGNEPPCPQYEITEDQFAAYMRRWEPDIALAMTILRRKKEFRTPTMVFRIPEETGRKRKGCQK